MGEIYGIREDYGITFTRNLNHEFISAEELEILIGQLSATLSMMKAKHASQEDLKRSARVQYETVVFSHVKLLVSIHHEFLEYSPEKRRKASDPIFSGVYFAVTPARQGEVKIGFSADIYKRTKGLMYSLNGSPIKIIAVLTSNDPRVVERVLHRQFAPHLIKKEWFHAQPVLDWLKNPIMRFE